MPSQSDIAQDIHAWITGGDYLHDFPIVGGDDDITFVGDIPFDVDDFEPHEPCYGRGELVENHTLEPINHNGAYEAEDESDDQNDVLEHIGGFSDEVQEDSVLERVEEDSEIDDSVLERVEVEEELEDAEEVPEEVEKEPEEAEEEPAETNDSVLERVEAEEAVDVILERDDVEEVRDDAEEGSVLERVEAQEDAEEDSVLERVGDSSAVDFINSIVI